MKLMALVEMMKHLLNKWTFLFLGLGFGAIDSPFKYKRVIILCLAIFCGKMMQEAETNAMTWFNKPKKKSRKK
ncbi:MAG: hypothetical protein JW812_00270 [Alphaproteobacteria bacterium]|nr:hypothetical protein [Alphaproteobacteria bacterium]MBN2779797.1 hypothetical protein [Alphaproteobacteria bacterium]